MGDGGGGGAGVADERGAAAVIFGGGDRAAVIDALGNGADEADVTAGDAGLVGKRGGRRRQDGSDSRAGSAAGVDRDSGEVADGSADLDGHRHVAAGDALRNGDA